MKIKVKMHCKNCVRLLREVFEEEGLKAKVELGSVECNEADIGKIKKLIQTEGYTIE
jgi:hypothetical protein